MTDAAKIAELQAQLAEKDELLKAQELVVAEKDAALAVAREALIVAASRLGDSTLFGCLSDERIDAMAKKLAADQRVFEAAEVVARSIAEWANSDGPLVSGLDTLTEALKSREGL